MKLITDNDILFDLEYKGIQSLLCEMSLGLNVPACLVERVKKIIKDNYGINLREVNTNITKSGYFCLIPYTNQKIVSLVY